jgi:thioredoxin-like negative regulator of GroEL
LNEGPRALQCARSAIKSDPGNYQARYELALRLMERQQFAEAESHLHWCLQRTPDRQILQAKLKEALRGRLDAERRAAAGTPRLQ